MPRMRTLLTTSAVALIAIVLSGCLQFESTFDIADDGTVDLGILIAFDVEQLQDLAEMFGESDVDLGELTGEDLLAELGTDSDPCADLTTSIADFEVTTEEFDEDGLVGVRCTVEGIPIEALTDLGTDSALAITQADGETTFDLTMSGLEELTGGQDEALPIPGLDFEEIFEIRIIASAPGSLTDHNATSTDGASASWVITPDASFVSGDEAVMSARWAPGGGGGGSSWLVPLLIALAVIAVLGAVALVLTRNRRDSGAAGSSDVPSGTPPPPPPPATSGPATSPPPPPPPPTSGPTGSPPPPPPAPSG